MMVTIMDLATHRLGRPASTEEDFREAGLSMFGGCVCTATIAAYNAHPSKAGYWRCSDCIGTDGWASVEEADREIAALARGLR
jgi:hypothetical protein